MHGTANSRLGKIGPNAIIQLANAMRACNGPGQAEAFFRRAGYDDLFFCPPAEMIDQRIPARLFQLLWQEEPDIAPEIARDAGRRTANYVMEHRIPQVAKLFLRIMPKHQAARFLMKAIHRNAWTFAGSGQCDVSLGRRFMISIKDNPLVMPECAWHEAVFQRLFQELVTTRAQVRHLPATADPARTSRFEIDLFGRQGRPD